MAKSSTNMSRIILSICCSMRLRLDGGNVAFFITCTCIPLTLTMHFHADNQIDTASLALRLKPVLPPFCL